MKEVVLVEPYNEHTDINHDAHYLIFTHKDKYLVEDLEGNLSLVGRIYPAREPKSITILKQVVSSLKEKGLDNSMLTVDSCYPINCVVEECLKVLGVTYKE